MRAPIPVLAGLAFIAIGACSRDAAGPAQVRAQLAVLAGDGQFGLPGQPVEEALQVIATDPVTGAPLAEIAVDWRVASGSGTVVPEAATTDARGIAAARLTLGPELGEVRVEAAAKRPVGAAPAFVAAAVERPEIDALAPTAASAGDTITITGRNFNPVADYNSVLFDGIRGHLVSAAGTELRVVVPACVPTRSVAVQVALGAVTSAPQPLAATAAADAPLDLAPGEAQVFADPAELACLRLPGAVADAAWLVIAQNATTSAVAPMPFQLTALNRTAPAAEPVPEARPATAAEAWEWQLRARDRAFFQDRIETPALARAIIDPQLGDRRSFRVLTSVTGNETASVTAEVRAISAHAVIYLDLAAPAGGFSTADLQQFANIFDDPIHPATTGVFGTPSDLDGNGRVIILLTPRVNALTPRGEPSFIAGYFYGCDLVPRTRCADTNSGEIFYSLVPDPQARFSDARSSTQVLETVPPVLAHEFQHMISFAQRGQTLDALWLSEGLAHMAEDVVADAFAARGDLVRARGFRRPNYLRAHRFLAQVPQVSLIADDRQGTIAQRGAAWLFLRYLRGQYGGDMLLTRLTQTTLSSTQNVTAQTGQPWATLLADFSVALYADGAAELAGVPLDARYAFTDFDPRIAIAQEAGSYPLTVLTQPLGDGAVSGELPAAGSSYLRLDAPAESAAYPPVHLVFAGRYGGPFRAGTVPQLAVLRLR